MSIEHFHEEAFDRRRAPHDVAAVIFVMMCVTGEPARAFARGLNPREPVCEICVLRRSGGIGGHEPTSRS
jgi:hypothetical protein